MYFEIELCTVVENKIIGLMNYFHKDNIQIDHLL